MTLKGHYALSFKTRASFGTHLEHLNEDRLHCQRRRCSAMTLWQYKVYADIRIVVLKIYVNFLILRLRPYITYTRIPHAFSLSSSIVLFSIVNNREFLPRN